jgi:hypothetical protein
MRQNHAGRLACWAVSVAALALLPLLTASAPALGAPGAPGETIYCRVLEAHSSEHPKVTLVVFRYRDQNERARLGASLRDRSGTFVKFQTHDGQWHPATVLRLKSCFGRGALLIEAGTARLAEGDEFVLQFPEKGTETGMDK